MTHERRRLRLQALEQRVVPATLLHSLFPDPTGPQEFAEFGSSVATGSNYRVVGSRLVHQFELQHVGQAFVYDAITNNLVSTLNNPSPAASDYFGSSVAVSGKLVVVGACRDDTGAIDAGSAYVYDMASPTPTAPIEVFNNPSPIIGEEFGQSVAVSGTIVVVGAPSDNTGASNAGSAYVYDLSNPTPTTPIAVLNNPAPTNIEYFGIAVAVSGSYVVVGANGADSAYVYDLSSPVPTTPIATLNNPSPSTADSFGLSVAVSGTYAVVGAFSDDILSSNNAGSAHIYDLSIPTPTTPFAVLNNPSPAVGDHFGKSVAVSGNYVVIGAPQDNAGAGDAGSVYVYDLNSMTPTTPIATLNNPSPAAFDHFGVCVAVSGKSVAVGAQDEIAGAKAAGSVYVYDLGSITPTVPIAMLNNPTAPAKDYFGLGVAISDKYVAVGSYQDDTGTSGAGSTYVYDLSRPTPTSPIVSLNNPSPEAFDYFGSAIALSGKYVVVGAFFDDSGAIDAGSAYIYDLLRGARHGL